MENNMIKIQKNKTENMNFIGGCVAEIKEYAGLYKSTKIDCKNKKAMERR